MRPANRWFVASSTLTPASCSPSRRSVEQWVPAYHREQRRCSLRSAVRGDETLDDREKTESA
jgi:hypothetical protein